MMTIYFQYLIKPFNGLKLLFFRYFNFFNFFKYLKNANNVSVSKESDPNNIIVNKSEILDEKSSIPIIQTIQETTDSNAVTISIDSNDKFGQELNIHTVPMIQQDEKK